MAGIAKQIMPGNMVITSTVMNCAIQTDQISRIARHQMISRQ